MPADRAAPPRIVLVPGAFDTAAGFWQAGFEAAVRARGLELEVVIAELEFASLTDRSMIDRLHNGPLRAARAARAAGCRSVWLGGVSLGAYMALACAGRFPDDLDGLCLIAPYLGTRIVMRSIERSGGLGAWNAAAVAGDDEDVAIWRFISAAADWPAPIYTGYLGATIVSPTASGSARRRSRPRWSTPSTARTTGRRGAPSGNAFSTSGRCSRRAAPSARRPRWAARWPQRRTPPAAGAVGRWLPRRSRCTSSPPRSSRGTSRPGPGRSDSSSPITCC